MTLVSQMQSTLKTSARVHLLAVLAAASGLAFGFIKIWSEVAEHDATAIDSAILRSLRVPGHSGMLIGPAWLEQAMAEISSLGGATVLTLLIAGTCGFFLVKRMWHQALIMALATLTGSGAVSLLKHFFGRARPEVVDHLVAVQTLSFPSGHAANSAVVYLTLAALATDLGSTRPVRVYVLACAIALILLIGLSRLFLGVHWPSDVLAGWAFGASWALLWRVVAGWVSPQ